MFNTTLTRYIYLFPMPNIIHPLKNISATDMRKRQTSAMPNASPAKIDISSIAEHKTQAVQATTAENFETAFIAQMLQFSGLADALTIGGGEMMQSFTQFYLEELAQDISKNGGFGIADKISSYIDMKEKDYGELGRL